MAKFRLEIDLDDDNTWMNTEFSLGLALKRTGDGIINGHTNFKEMFRARKEIKDAYGNVVGHYEMTP